MILDLLEIYQLSFYYQAHYYWLEEIQVHQNHHLQYFQLYFEALPLRQRNRLNHQHY